MLPTLLVKGNLLDHPDVIPVDYILNDMYTKYLNENKNFFILKSLTGSGKSSVLLNSLYKTASQFLSGSIVASCQPRVIATEMIANDLDAANWSELKLGKSLGYAHGNANVFPKEFKSLMLYTYGTLYYKLIHNATKVFNTHSVIVLDECHELSQEAILLFHYFKYYKEKLPLIILTSATLDIDLYKKYFNSDTSYSVEGIQYPKYSYYLNDSLTDEVLKKNKPINYIIEIIKSQTPKGTKSICNLELESFTKDYKDELDSNEFMKDIIIFVSSEQEIKEFSKEIEKYKNKDDVILGLNRQRVMAKGKEFELATSSNNDIRRIIIATPVAEVAITMPNLGTVITLNWQQNMYYLGSNKYALLPSPISKASHTQKIGRVGRKEKGLVFNIFKKDVIPLMSEESENILQYDNVTNLFTAAGNIEKLDFIASYSNYKRDLILTEVKLMNLFSKNKLNNIGEIAVKFISKSPSMSLPSIWFLLMCWGIDHTKLLKEACYILAAMGGKNTPKDAFAVFNQKADELVKKIGPSNILSTSFNTLSDEDKTFLRTVKTAYTTYYTVLDEIYSMYGDYETYNYEPIQVDIFDIFNLCFSLTDSVQYMYDKFSRKFKSINPLV